MFQAPTGSTDSSPSLRLQQSLMRTNCWRPDRWLVGTQTDAGLCSRHVGGMNRTTSELKESTMTNPSLDPTRHEPFDFSVPTPRPAVDPPAAWPVQQGWAPYPGFPPVTSEPPTKRRRVRRTILVIAILAAIFVSLNAGALLGWAAAKGSAIEANDKLVHAKAQLARASEQSQACAQAVGNAERIYELWDKIGNNENQWQDADPGSAARQRIAARLDQQYTELDRRIQEAKGAAESCPQPDPSGPIT
jgi:hypothetical protein